MEPSVSESRTIAIALQSPESIRHLCSQTDFAIHAGSLAPSAQIRRGLLVPRPLKLGSSTLHRVKFDRVASSPVPSHLKFIYLFSYNKHTRRRSS